MDRLIAKSITRAGAIYAHVMSSYGLIWRLQFGIELLTFNDWLRVNLRLFGRKESDLAVVVDLRFVPSWL